MIILSNSTAQTLAAGQSVTFDLIKRKAGCGEGFMQGGNAVWLKGNNAGASYDVSYGANIGATAPGQAQLSIQFNGVTLNETTAISTTATAGDLNNVSRATNIPTGCGFGNGTVTLTNTGTTEITVGANSVLKISRRS